ncbi:substrate-binding domain-containing protein, partial [candidate division KSB1 bacterium]|nr:substrate-binding domain-containing protein [candidate division KSB1 bacterium]
MKRPTISFIIHNLYDPYCQTLFSGISEGARQFDVNLLCFPGRDLKSPRGFDVEANYIYDLCTPKGANGIIICANVITNFIKPIEVERFYSRFNTIPILSIAVPIPGIPSVGINNAVAMTELVEHMVDQHAYNRIAFITGPLQNPEVQIRYESYLKVLKKRGIPIDPDLVVNGDFEIPSGYDAIRILMDERCVQFDAVIAANDNMAVGALAALRDCGLRVPEDVAIAGFDDNQPGFAATPPLTTVHQPIHQMGVKSIEMMLEMLKGETLPEQIHLPTQLVIRESCGCLPFTDSFNKSKKHQKQIKKFTPKSLINTMEQDPTIHDMGFETEKLNNLISSLFYDIHHLQSTRFIRQLHDCLKVYVLSEQSVAPCYHLINTIRDHILNDKTDIAIFFHLTNLLDQAGSLIRDVERRIFHQHQLQHESNTRILREISESLTTRHTIKELMQVLNNALQRIDIQTAYTALFESFEDKLETGRPSVYVNLELALIQEKKIRIRKSARRFSSETLIPFKLRPGERYTLIVLPLYFRTEHFGYVALEHLPNITGLTYESLRDQISIALHGIRYHQDLIKAKEESEDRAQKLDESNKELEQFAYVASHDLQEPLRMVSSYVSLIAKRYQDKIDSDDREFFDFALDGTKRMQILIRDLLNYSRVTTQAKPFETTDTELILKAVLANLSVTISETKTKVTHTKLPSIMADQVQLERLFQNLIGNAIKYNQNTPSIHISADKKDGQWIFAFKDNGIGIDPQFQDRIFGIFQRLYGRDEYSGTGIGLAVSKKIVE